MPHGFDQAIDIGPIPVTARGAETIDERMIETPRREFLKLAFAGALAAAGAILDGARAGAESLAESAPFAPDSVVNRARDLAKTAFKPPNAALPEPFPSLTFDQYATIRRNPASALWSDGHTPFTLEPLHRGFIYTNPVDLYVVESGAAQRIIYDRNAFDFGKIDAPAQIPDIGFSGVRILKGAPGGWQDLAMFQGATFFRSLARGQAYGVTARGLSIRTGDAQGEEFPLFRALWLEKPSPAADMLVIHALLDSTSLTGAFRFTLHAGEATIIDTELTLFARADIDHIGLGAMAGVYLFGSLDHLHADDVRQAVHDIDGLQILTGAGEWIWRPITNRTTLQISAFGDRNPRGFGMLQRNRNFGAYGDDEAHWEQRPSLWIEPIGDWGEGEVVLVEIPTESETNDNVIAQWRPKAGLATGGTVAYAYRQFWCWTPPARPDLAVAMSSHVGRAGKRHRFAVEFISDAFADVTQANAAKAIVEAAPGQISNVRVFPYPDRRSVRVLFDLDNGSDVYSELRLRLRAEDKPVSETWLYRWTV